MSRRALLAGNWKMNGLRQDVRWLKVLAEAMPDFPVDIDIVLCPPATLIAQMAQECPDWLALGGQDCAAHAKGAYTGDISPVMLADLGCRYVIVGHSERRTGHAETDQKVRAKVEAARAAELIPIICVGESLEQREQGKAVSVITDQMIASLPGGMSAHAVVIAYEPVWAIGTGKTATPEDAQIMHQALRTAWPGENGDALRLLYGGSLNPSNVFELMAQPDIDGALVGGASLEVKDFAALIRSLIVS